MLHCVEGLVSLINLCYFCRDMLERNLGKNQLTDLLTLNGQEIPSGVDKVQKRTSTHILEAHYIIHDSCNTDFGPPVGRDDVRRAQEVPRVRERAACVPQRRRLPVYGRRLRVDEVPVQVGRNNEKTMLYSNI